MQGDAWFQAAQRPQVHPLIRRIAAVQDERDPDVVIPQQEARRHDTNQRSGLAIQHESSSNQPRIGIELLLP